MPSWSQICYSQDGVPPWPLSAVENSTFSRQMQNWCIWDRRGSGVSRLELSLNTTFKWKAHAKYETDENDGKQAAHIRK